MLAIAVVILNIFFAAPRDVPPPKWPDYKDSDVILFQDGKKVLGTIERWTGSLIFFRVSGKVKQFDKKDVLALSMGKNLNRSVLGQRWKKCPNTAPDWYWMGVTCAKNRLGVEAVLCYRHVLKLDPDYRKAHLLLGHAMLNGKWLSRAEVKKKVLSGYVLENGVLVYKKSKGHGRTKVKKTEEKPSDGLRFVTSKKWTDAELRRFEKERKNRKQDIKKFNEQLHAEYQGVPWAQRYKIRSKYFNIECNSTRKVTYHYAQIMDSLYETLSARFPAYRHGKKGPSTVYIYRNADDFRDKTNMFYGIGGFYMPSTGFLYTYHGTFGMTQTTFNVLAHEGTHQFQGKVLRGFENVPTWLIEGLAVYFGDGARLTEDGKIKTGNIPRDRLLHIQDKIREGEQDPLSKLVTLSHREFSGTHYADAWALIYFLVKSGKKSQDLLSAYWNIATKRKIRIDDFQKLAVIHSGSIAALEKKYLDFITKLQPESAGELRGDYFYSREFCFEFKRLDSGWRFYEKNQRAFILGQKAPEGSGKVEVFFRNNDTRAQSGKDYIKEYITNYHEKILPNLYSNISAERVKIHDVDAFKFTYEDDPNKLGLNISLDGISNYQLRDLIRKLKEKIKKEGGDLKYIEYMIVDVDGTFSIKTSSKKKEFEKYKDCFLKVPAYFELIHQRRW